MRFHEIRIESKQRFNLEKSFSYDFYVIYIMYIKFIINKFYNLEQKNYICFILYFSIFIPCCTRFGTKRLKQKKLNLIMCEQYNQFPAFLCDVIL